MSQKIAISIILVCASLLPVLAQQKRPYDVVMKDINGAFTTLKKDLDSNSFSLAAEDAVKLQGLFKETEDFWTPFKTKDAIDFAKGAQAGFQTVAAAAKEGNGQKAQAAYGAVGKNCKGCHDSHRELMPDKSFKIKP